MKIPCLKGLAYLPFLLVVVSYISFCTTYIIAVAQDDVAAYFPYISDTGIEAPESCIFSQFLNIATALALCTMYTRYKLVETITKHADTSIAKMNKAGLVLGCLSALGLSLVANFQETKVEVVHVLGASLVLGVGVVYEFVQTFLTYQMHPDFNGLYVARVRLTLSIVSLVSMLTAFVTAAYSRSITDAVDKRHWKPEEKGFSAHIVSTITEWITALVFLGFFFTYIRDFQKVKIEAHTDLKVRHLDEEFIDSEEFSVTERAPLLA